MGAEEPTGRWKVVLWSRVPTRAPARDASIPSSFLSPFPGLGRSPPFPSISPDISFSRALLLL